MASDPGLRAQKLRDRLARKVAEREFQAQSGTGTGTDTAGQSTAASQSVAAALWCEQKLQLLLADVETFATIRWNPDDYARNTAGQEIMKWQTIMLLLSSTFEECWQRWMMGFELQRINRNRKGLADKTALSCVRRSKEKFGQLKERVDGLPAEAIIVDPARLGVRKVDAAAKAKIMATLSVRPRDERRMIERVSTDSRPVREGDPRTR